jgi:hypothetical protein
VEKRELIYTVGGVHIIMAIMENSMEVFQKKKKSRNSYPTSGYISKLNEISISKIDPHSMFIAPVFTLANTWTHLGEHQWIMKAAYIHNGTLFSNKKK